MWQGAGGQRGRKQISTQIFQNSKSNASAHTNVSLSSKGRASHPHLASQKCLTKLHAAKRPDHCRKDVQKVGNQRHSQWHPVSKHRESHPQCMQCPPKRNLGERSSTWRKEKGRRESSAFRKQPRRSSEEERRGD